ncbi:MAG: leucine-rich repeat domain-containing protein [Lentisphaeria bacterium]|nr:leucine-rich repeat domain-containing protein [Lentisphaeria bacterium]
MQNSSIMQVFILGVSLFLPGMAYSETIQQDRRLEIIREIIVRNISDSGGDITKIEKEVSQRFPLVPFQTEEYRKLLNKRDVAVKKRFPKTDQQLRADLQKRAEKLFPLYRIGDEVSVVYQLTGKPFRVTGKFYRKSRGILYIGSARIAERNLEEEFIPKFDPAANQSMRERYIAREIESYRQQRQRFADSLYKDEILRSQGYLKFNHKWVTAKDFIQLELNQIAAQYGVSVKQLLKGIPSVGNDKSLPMPEVEFDDEHKILIKYPKEAPNKFYKIPEAVTVIGKNAFEGCKNLEMIQIQGNTRMVSEGAFKECENLSMVILPPSITTIGRYAFEGCKKLEDIVIPEQVTTIPSGCFTGSGLETVSLHDHITSIEKYSFADTKLKTITIPLGVRKIEGSAFWRTQVEIKSDNAFFQTDGHGVLFDRRKFELIYAPPRLVSYRIPGNIQKIGDGAFAFSDLANIHIPSNVKHIGKDAFIGCKKLKSISFASGISSIGSGAFSQSGLVKVILPDSITVIGQAAFSNCPNLEEITFPRDITFLEWAVCANCENLRKVTVSPRLTQIKNRAFWDCKKLTEINVPPTIVSIDKGSFSGTPIAQKMETIAKETFRIPSVIASFNWKFSPEDFRAQGFSVFYRGTGGDVQEYVIANSFESFSCLKLAEKSTPFCYVFSGNQAKAATTEIAEGIKGPNQKYLPIRSFDRKEYDNGLSRQWAAVLWADQFKILIQFDRNDQAKMVIYKLDDNQDETYYQMLHYK